MTVVPGSIRQTVKSKLLGLVKDVEADYKIVQVDPFTLRIVDSASSMHEIMDSGVYLLEIVTKGRQPYPTMSSVYFVSPSEEVVQQIIKDFTPPTQRLASGRKGPAYKEAHVFFTDSVPPALFDALAGSPAAPHIRSFVETFLNFIALESRAYHLGADAAQFGRVWREKPMGMTAGGPVLGDFQRMASQIVGACVTMNETPVLRYQKESFQGQALKLASLVQESFDAYSRANPAFKPLRDGQLIILDRTVDMLAPLLHEFTLQAMANDLLKIVDGSKFAYKFSSGGKEAGREVSLDENDSMWTSLRHKHIAEVSQVIIGKFNEFLSENRAAQGGGEAGAKNLAELREMMNAMTEFHELKSVYSLHLTIAQECIAASDKRKLIDAAKVEQSMATGLDADGEQVEDLWSELAPLLDRSNLTGLDKLRLVMIYLLTQPGLSDSERKSLIDHAKLGREEMESLRQMAIISADLKGAAGQRKPAVQGKRGARKTLLDEEMPYEVSRYVPATKIILDDAAHGELDEQEFPFLKASSSASTSAGATGTPKISTAAPISLRARPPNVSSTSGTARPSEPTKGSISAFILGGLTYSEMRAAYELASRNQRDFYVGGDRVLTPESFIQLLRETK